MSAIHMPTELVSGVAEMDRQHDQLFNQIVQVKCAEDLIAHFAWEEEIARIQGVLFEEGHIKAHRQMTAFIRLKVAEVSRGDCNIPALMVFMERCFETHVVQYDLKLGHDLQADSGKIPCTNS